MAEMQNSSRDYVLLSISQQVDYLIDTCKSATLSAADNCYVRACLSTSANTEKLLIRN